jgi:hypothetical protein
MCFSEIGRCDAMLRGGRDGERLRDSVGHFVADHQGVSLGSIETTRPELKAFRDAQHTRRDTQRVSAPPH